MPWRPCRAAPASLLAPQAPAKLKETWAKVEFVFQPHRGGSSGGSTSKAADGKSDAKSGAGMGGSSSGGSGAGASANSSSSGGEVCTVKMVEEDFEALEDNQVLVQARIAVPPYRRPAIPLYRYGSLMDCIGCCLLLPSPIRTQITPTPIAYHLTAPAYLHPRLQGMMANRFMSTFRDDILAWNRRLNGVADVVQLMAEIQRSWACEREWVEGKKGQRREQQRRGLP